MRVIESSAKRFTGALIMQGILRYWYFLFLPLVHLEASDMAFPQSNFEVKYPIDYPEQKLYASSRYLVLRETNAGFFFEYDFSGETHIVYLPRRKDDGRSLSYREGKFMRTNGLVFRDFEKGHILFDTQKPLTVKRQAGGKVSLQVTIGGKPTVAPFPEQYFQVKSEDELRAERIAERENALYGEGPKRLVLSEEELKALSAKANLLAKKIKAMERVETRPIKDPQNGVCIIETSDGVGTGFLCEMDGRVYVFTNSHVIGGGEDLSITTISGIELQPVLIELAEDRDLARILVDRMRFALEYTKKSKIGDKVTVYGNSGGAGVVTQLHGKVTGVAHDLIETDAEFISGNSGSPILNKKNQVIGVATYAVLDADPSDWVSKDTRFDGVRRFAVKIDDKIEWMPFHADALKAINREIVVKEQILEECVYLMMQYYSDPFATIALPDSKNSELADWVRGHNANVREYQDVRGKYLSQSDTQVVSKVVRNRGIAKGRSLSAIFAKHAEEVGTIIVYPETTFYLDKIEQIQQQFEFLATENEGLNQRIW
ncbi:MAG: trypsin-like peptidase domain-containing protein [Verrucomicrobiota bacterium]